MGREDGLLGAFEEHVLLAVARGRGEAYGMTVRRALEELTGREVTIGAVYATLDRLESKGLVSSAYAGEDGAPVRRRFQIGPEGIEALERARDARAELWRDLDLGTLGADAEAGR